MLGKKILVLVAAAALALAASARPASAVCADSVPLNQSVGQFTGCGTAPEAFFWLHHMGVQRAVNSNTSANTTAGGVDSGIASFAGMLSNTGGENYVIGGNWGNFGTDGCVSNVDVQETDVSCATGGNTVGVTDFMISGKSSSNPNLAKVAVLSVDANELLQAYFFEQAGALSIDGDPCGGDAFQTKEPPDTACGTIPQPGVFPVAGSCTTAGCNVNITAAARTIPILDDCAVAASKAINCPRNLDGGLQLMYKRGACGVGAFPAGDTRALAAYPASGTSTVATNYSPYFPQDLNLNGILDAGEQAFAPVILASNSPTSTQLSNMFVPKIAGATDCLFFALALRVDPGAVLALGVQHQPVYSQFVSVNATAGVNLATGTPASDRVLNLVASKTSGKANVSWDTTAELTVAGFNLIGTKKSGGEVQLNSSLIPAKKGTTGEGASYSADLKAGDLKGSTAVFVEVVKTNGAKERFGPASF
ncbi:MAG TPA: hypothetical protein VGR67_13025 [Candidatus Polarisedimenticolia bacterium]|nr:hypothetical protein [Candidatus Polarisedimenticolia bacterium]